MDREAKSQGAQVACGGQREGQMLRPTVLLQVKPTLKVSCQEVFAPIVIIDKIQTIDQAIDRVNDFNGMAFRRVSTPMIFIQH